jgi:hypothetical protein
LGDAEGARRLLSQVVEVSRRVLGTNHPTTLAFAANLAASLEPEPPRKV